MIMMLLKCILDELKKVPRIDGATFVQTIFIVEAQLKASVSNLKLTKEEFISKINEISTVKFFDIRGKI